MTDALVRIHLVAGDLLSRVDDTLARLGAPAGHAVWSLLRRGGLLTADAVEAVVRWSPADLLERAALLRRQAEQQEAVAASLRVRSSWQGQASAAFHGRLTVAERGLVDAGERGLALAACLEELAASQVDGRRRLARVLAGTLRSAEAVMLTAGPLPGLRAEAAATLAAAVLSEVDGFWTAGLALTSRLDLADRQRPADLDISANASLSVDL